MIHQVRIILVGHLIDHQSFIKLTNHVCGRGNRYPKNWSRQTATTREPADLHGKQTAVCGTCCTTAEKRNDRGRNNRDTFWSRTRETSVLTQLPRNARQQVFVRKVRQAHRNRTCCRALRGSCVRTLVSRVLLQKVSRLFRPSKSSLQRARDCRL